MIITLTINPSVDRNLFVDRLVFEDRAYILSRSDSAGGRGINASRVIHSFGSKTLAVVTSGGPNGERLQKLLGKAGFPVKVVAIKNEIRNNFTITDRQGLAVKLNERGPAITSEELASVEKTIENWLEGASWLMLCGSIPPEVSSDFYTKLIRMAREKKVKTLLDTDGDALLHGVEAGPTVVTPNQQEAERLLNRALITRAHFAEAATRIKAMGAESVMVSLGSRGVVAVNGDQLLEAIPPRTDAVSPLGAGDALAAAFVWANGKKKDFADSVRWAVAAWTASAKQPGVEFANLDQTKEIYKSVEVKRTKPIVLLGLLACLLFQSACSSSTSMPTQYNVKFDTSKGPFTVEVFRDWAPLGSDRFYELVTTGFYDDARFFRVVPKFVVQFGISRDPKVSAHWREMNIPDDAVHEKNLRGYLTYAMGGRDSRTTQVFINLADNLNLDAQGFSPFGRVIDGMNVVDSLYSGYGEAPQQDLIQTQGNEYLKSQFPLLDYIKTAKIEN